MPSTRATRTRAPLASVSALDASAAAFAAASAVCVSASFFCPALTSSARAAHTSVAMISPGLVAHWYLKQQHVHGTPMISFRANINQGILTLGLVLNDPNPDRKPDPLMMAA